MLPLCSLLKRSIVVRREGEDKLHFDLRICDFDSENVGQNVKLRLLY